MPQSRKPIDVHVGARVRLRRIQLDYPKDLLAAGLGVSSDDMSAREEGSERISATMLMQICALLDVTPSYFFEGFPSGDEETSDDAHQAHEARKQEKQIS